MGIKTINLNVKKNNISYCLKNRNIVYFLVRLN